jgi:predicted metal-dependent hydrolase
VGQVIAAFVADLMFQMRIESAAEKLDLRVRWLENADQVTSTDLDGLIALGPEGILVDQLARMGPILLIFDLGNKAIPWETWIPVLKTTPATRRIPVICYGSHVDVDTLKDARKTGADEVVARSRFVTALPELIQKYIRRTDEELLAETCEEPLHPDAVKGLDLFNKGDYFDAHEYLEEAWKDDLTSGRDLYRGVLQVAVAYFQIRRANYRGTIKMFQRSRQWLDPLPDTCRGVDVAQLRMDAYEVHDQVLTLGPDRMNEIQVDSLQPVLWELIETR